MCIRDRPKSEPFPRTRTPLLTIVLATSFSVGGVEVASKKVKVPVPFLMKVTPPTPWSMSPAKVELELLAPTVSVAAPADELVITELLPPFNTSIVRLIPFRFRAPFVMTNWLLEDPSAKLLPREIVPFEIKVPPV